MNPFYFTGTQTHFLSTGHQCITKAEVRAHRTGLENDVGLYLGMKSKCIKLSIMDVLDALSFFSLFFLFLFVLLLLLLVMFSYL